MTTSTSPARDERITHLSNAIGRWADETPTGGRTGRVRIVVTDHAGQEYGVHELTDRQTDELTDVFDGSGFLSRLDARRFASMLANYGPTYGTDPAAYLIVSSRDTDDLGVGDDASGPHHVPIGGTWLGSLTGALEVLLENLLAQRRNHPLKESYQEGDQVQVRPDLMLGGQPHTAAGQTGVVNYAKVITRAIPQGESGELYYSVRLDNHEDMPVWNFTADELTAAPETGHTSP